MLGGNCKDYSLLECGTEQFFGYLVVYEGLVAPIFRVREYSENAKPDVTVPS